MIARIARAPRRRLLERKINREHWPLLVHGIPWLSVIFGSLTVMLPIISPAPVVPPMAYLMLLSWCMLRPGVLPLWAGFPLGLIDDLLSGMPLGSSILVFSLTLIGLDLLDVQFPWRGFRQNWAISALIVAFVIPFWALVSGAQITSSQLAVILPQLLLSIAVLPILMGLAAVLDRLRLLRVRRVD